MVHKPSIVAKVYLWICVLTFLGLGVVFLSNPTLLSKVDIELNTPRRWQTFVPTTAAVFLGLDVSWDGVRFVKAESEPDCCALDWCLQDTLLAGWFR